MEYYQILGRETCPFCCKACEALKEKNLNFMFCEMEHSPDLIQFYKDKYNMKTVPIVLKIQTGYEPELIGGCMDLIEHLEVKNERSSEG
jgi:glutaredoxin